MNYSYWLNRITGFNLFDTVSLEATNLTMEPTEKGEESVKETITFVDADDKCVPTAVTEGYGKILYQDPKGNIRVQHVWNGENIVDPKFEPVVREIPDELVGQFKKNAELVKQFYLAFENNHVPECLETWVYFNLYILRIPAIRNLRNDVRLGCHRYLWDRYPRFIGPRKEGDKTAKNMGTFWTTLDFYWESVFGDTSYLRKPRLPKMLFSLFEDESDTHPTGVFLKDPTTSWDEVQTQLKGVAFETSASIANRLMVIENIQDLISVVTRKEKHEEKIFIVTGPIMFARVSCCSPFKPYVTASTKALKFDKAGFVSTTNPGITTKAAWYFTRKDLEAVKVAASAAVQTGHEFLVNQADAILPVSECIGTCACKKKGKKKTAILKLSKEDKGSGKGKGGGFARDVSQPELKNQELKLGEGLNIRPRLEHQTQESILRKVDSSKVVNKSANSSSEVISADLSDADGSRLLASSSISSSTSSSDNPTEGLSVPGKVSDITTPAANANIVPDEVMQSEAGGEDDHPTPRQPLPQTGASGPLFSRRIKDTGASITTTPQQIPESPQSGSMHLKRGLSGISKDGNQDDGGCHLGEQSVDALPSARRARHQQQTDRDWASLSREWNDSLKRKFPNGRKSVPFEVKIPGKENTVGKINWGSFMTSFNV